MKIEIQISAGELLDRISILTLKWEATGKDTFFKERADLFKIARQLENHPEVYSFINYLSFINRQLWQVENEVREFERNDDFGEEFIKSARAVYTLNDERFETKKRINEKYNSEIREEKIYS